MPGGISPDGLLQLLRICRLLCQFALALDRRGFTEFFGSPMSLGLKIPAWFVLDVVDSVIEAELESVTPVVAFFAGIALPP